MITGPDGSKSSHLPTPEKPEESVSEQSDEEVKSKPRESDGTRVSHRTVDTAMPSPHVSDITGSELEGEEQSIPNEELSRRLIETLDSFTVTGSIPGESEQAFAERMNSLGIYLSQTVLIELDTQLVRSLNRKIP
ncbi:MAG: hypothetical protein ACR2PT_08765 [Endozoicomonas sp.]